MRPFARFERRSTTGRPRGALLVALLERLFAGVIVIGLLLWGASILATPTLPSEREGAPETPARILPGSGSEPSTPASASRPPAEEAWEEREDDEDDEDDDEDERDEDDDGEKRAKGKGRGKGRGKGASG